MMTALDKAIDDLESGLGYLVDAAEKYPNTIDNVPNYVIRRLDKDLTLLRRLRRGQSAVDVRV